MRPSVRLRLFSLVLALAGCKGKGGAADAGTPADAALADAGTPADASAAGDAGAAPDLAVAAPPLALHATSGWQVYPGGGYHYGPSILIDSDKSIHMWTCSPGTGGAWDFVRYHHSSDGGHSWSADVVALAPTAGSLDAYSTCDPGAVKIGGYFYVGYTSTTNPNGTANDVYVARATAPAGPFAKWNGVGWGGDPKPLVHYTGQSTYYGFGEPALVLMGKKLFVYYSDDQAVQYTDVATVDDATVDDWPLHLVDHGHAIARTHAAEDSADVKFVDARRRFLAVTTLDRFSANASLGVYESADGLRFTPVPYLGARAQPGAHNAGLSSGLDGHLDVAAANFVAYAYQPPGSSWGNWPTYLDPVSVGEAALGTTVAGEASSIVGGDWAWSAPRAWDGDAATAFSTASHASANAEEWAWVDVGAPLPLAGVTLTPRPGGYGFPVDFTVQTSADAATWVTVPQQSHTGFANPGSAAVTLAFAAPVTARYLRIDATKLGADNLGGYYLQLAEIQPFVAP